MLLAMLGAYWSTEKWFAFTVERETSTRGALLLSITSSTGVLDVVSSLRAMYLVWALGLAGQYVIVDFVGADRAGSILSR